MNEWLLVCAYAPAGLMVLMPRFWATWLVMMLSALVYAGVETRQERSR